MTPHSRTDMDKIVRSHNHITSHHIIYHIIYHITSHNHITSRHIMSHIISYLLQGADSF